MTFKVLLHHYGRFTSPPGRKFVAGLVATVDPVELDNFSTNQVKLILTNSLGYDFNSPTFLYLRNPNCSLDSGLIPLADAIQDRDMLLTYTKTYQNRLLVYVSWVEISPLVVANQRKDERNKKENQGKSSCSKSYLTNKIPRRITNLYYTLPPNNTLSGMKAIKNDYDTNVMYNIAKVSGKLQLFVSHYQIDLSTMLIPNDGSLEESFAGIISEETKIKLKESLNYLHQMQKRNNKKFDYYELLGELGFINKTKPTTPYTQTIFNFVVHNNGQLVLDDTKTTRSMASSANEARKTIVSKLQRELEAEATFANQLLCNLTRYREQMRIREIQMTMMQNMPTTSLNSYGLHALLMTHEADIRTTNNLISSRQELLKRKSSLTVTRQYRFLNNEALDEEACLEEQILSLLHRFADRFTNRRPEINKLMILDDHPLIEYVYALETSKNIIVAQKLPHDNMGHSLCCNPRGGVEFQQYACLLSNLECVFLPDIQDRWFWSLSASGEFSVTFVRRFIDDHMLLEVSFKTKWIKAVSIKVNIHAWKVNLDCLPTRFNLSRRGIDIQSILCPCCDMVAETSNHLFFTCCMVRDIYRKIVTWWGIKLVNVASFDGWMTWIFRMSFLHRMVAHLEVSKYIGI
ncbi:oligopeptide transporter [Tanacetum coccineum]